jgi:hypothetical protein
MERKLGVGVAVLGVVLMISMAFPVYDRLFGRKRLRFPYLARPIPAATYDALAATAGWAKAELDVAPGTALRGLVRKPSSSTRPWVLFYPGNDESQLERGHGFLTRLGGEADLGLAVFAYRGYDASDGKSELAQNVPKVRLEAEPGARGRLLDRRPLCRARGRRREKTRSTGGQLDAVGARQRHHHVPRFSLGEADGG